MKARRLSRALFVEAGKRGGKTRAARLSAARRKAIARKAAKARWGKRKPRPHGATAAA